MAKRSHVESSPSHGDVVPQTPVETGEVLDDTPFDQMASPQKTGRHGDGPGSVNLLGCIRNIECLDIEPDVALQCDDVDTLIQHELNLNEDPYEEGLDLDASLKELSFPYSAEEPAVSYEELQRLDAIADMVEVQRLFGLQVLQDDTLPQEAKSLSTRFANETEVCCGTVTLLDVSKSAAYPSLLKSQDGSCFLLVHVDDLLVVGSRKSVFEELVPELRKKYNIAIEAMSKGGDEISCNSFTISPIGLSAMDTNAADGQFEVKFMVTWLLMLVGYGVYLNLTLGCRKGDFVPADDGADGFSTSDDMGNVGCCFGFTDVAVAEKNELQLEWDPPAFSPEGLLFWLYRRCSGREERAAAARDPQRLERYRQRKLALQEMLTFLHHASPVEYQRAHEMLHTISDLSEDETSPQDDDQHGGIDLGAEAAAAVAAGMSMSLMGCDVDEPSAKGQTSLPVLVLVTWTVLCMGYTWWMLRGPWHQLGVDGPRPIDTMAIPEEPKTEERGICAESLVTFTMIRVLRRLGRASRAGNNGKVMKYHQWKRWLCTFIVHLPGTPDERDRIIETLVVEHPLSDDEESPIHGLDDDSRAMLMRSAGEVYVHLMGLLENTTLENAMQMLTVYGEALRTPEPMPARDMDDDDDDDDGDDSMGQSETAEERRRRYSNAPMEECSDPEYWALVHYGPRESDEAEEF
eukprot:s3802_g3.t2